MGMVGYPAEVHGVDPVVDDPAGGPVDLGEPLPRPDGEPRLLVLAPTHLAAVAERSLGEAAVVVETRAGEPGALAPALRDASGVDGALVVVPPGRPFDRCPRPICDGMPVGVVRASTAAEVRTAISTDRSAPVRAVLAMGTDEYLEPAGRLRDRLANASPTGIDVADWRASRVSRSALCRRLAGGPALAVYHGHGRAGGLSGYQALRWRHVAAVSRRRPIGALITLSCDALAAGTSGRPIAERFVAAGRAGAAFGAVQSVDVEAVVRLSRRFGTALQQDDPATVGDLLVAVHCRLERSGRPLGLEPYRLVGLPTRRVR